MAEQQRIHEYTDDLGNHIFVDTFERDGKQVWHVGYTERFDFAFGQYRPVGTGRNFENVADARNFFLTKVTEDVRFRVTRPTAASA